jgi:Uncharacterized conserved protein
MNQKTFSGSTSVALVRCGWQTVNIGDIAHTPGILRVLERHLPDTRLILWPGNFDRGVETLIRDRFPSVRFVYDAPQWQPAKPRPGDVTLAAAFAEAEVLLHGPGPSLVAHRDVTRWMNETGKPWGVLGVTLGSPVGNIDPRPEFPPALSDLLNTASFVFTRETKSLASAREAGVRVPLGFMPDATFALSDFAQGSQADELLERYNLAADGFLCVVPRLRLTPYWRMHPERGYSESEIVAKDRFNAEHVDRDLGKLRAAIVAWVRETGLRVFVCPEMSYQMDLFEPHILSPLPPDVRPHVAALDRYWLPDEAAAVFARARLVLSIECHSPILANAVGRPAIYLHQPQDTWKSQMYPDLGLGEWALPIENTTDESIAEQVLAIHRNYSAALATVTHAQDRAREAMARAATSLPTHLGGSSS